ncbi:Uncharacterized protein QTN25_003166 [Entamoeba marina]
MNIQSIRDINAQPMYIETAPPSCQNSVMDCSIASVSSIMADIEVKELLRTKCAGDDDDTPFYIGRCNNPIPDDSF